MADILYNSIENTYNVKLTQTEKAYVLDTIRRINPQYIKKYNSKDILNSLISIIGKKIVNQRKKQNDIDKKQPIMETFTDVVDINDYQQKAVSIVDYEVPNYVDQLKSGNVAITSILGISSQYQIQRLLNPDSVLEKHYLYLDSKYRYNINPFDSTFNEIVWAYADSPNVRNGSAVSFGSIKNIKAMKLYQTRIPWDVFVITAPLDVITTIPTKRRISILFHEFATQSFITHTQRKFHFIMQMLYNKASYEHAIELFPESEADSVFEFQTPILTFDKITCSFGDPYTKLSFHYETMKCTITDDGGGTPVINLPVAHTFGWSAITVYISGFTTAAPITDIALIDIINNPYGLLCLPSGISLYSINIYNVDISSATLIPGLLVDVYFNSYRINMILEFTCLKNI